MSSSTHEEKRQIFQRHFLLGKLSPNEIDALISYARVERYPAGREIFAKGSPGQCLMAVLRGSVKISSLSVGGKEFVFAIFNAGDIFGEIAVLDGEERSADATAMTECELLVLNRRDFLPVLEDHADLCMILLRILCRRLRQTTEQVEDVMFLHLESRVAKALLQLVESIGLRALHSPSVEPHVSQRELGNMAGGSRESVNKIFQNWCRRGLINLGKGSILIHTWKPSSALSEKSARNDRGSLDHALFSSTMNWTVMPLARTKATYVDGQACSSGARPSRSFPVGRAVFPDGAVPRRSAMMTSSERKL